MIGTNGTNFSHNLLLTDRHAQRICKAFASNSLLSIKWSRTQLSKIIQSGGFLGILHGPLMKVGLPLMKNTLTPLVKNVLIPLGLTAAASTAGARSLRV